MAGLLFGDYLARVVSLTFHDVQEILTEQSASGRRFGQTARALGLCEQCHVWQAASAQLAAVTPRADQLPEAASRRADRLLPFAFAARSAWHR